MRLGSLIGVTGLILDIIGAWYLARGIVKKTLEEMTVEAPQFSWDVNHAYVIGALTQKIEAKIGFVLLTLGFTFQAITYILNIELSSLNFIRLIILDSIVLIGVAIVSHFIVKIKVNNAKMAYLRKIIIAQLEETKGRQHIDDTKWYLRYLKVKFDDNISTEDALLKLLVVLDIGTRVY